MNLSERPMSEREKRNAEISLRMAEEGMVLLKNDHSILPLPARAKIALYGNGAVRTVRGGTGSGDPFNGGLNGGGFIDVDQSDRYHIHIFDALLAGGMDIVSSAYLKRTAAAYDEERTAAGQLGMGTFRFPELPVSEAEVMKHAAETDTAVYVICRNSGEGVDRRMYQTASQNGQNVEVGDYCLSDTEKENLRLVRKHFKKMIVVLNVGGILDASRILDADPDSILLMSLAGQEGGSALCRILSGEVTPSGKLTDTWAVSYEDYPASATFAENDGDTDREWYSEGLYVGYRYFDSFNKPVVYPFGYGLSYTQFQVSYSSCTLDGKMFRLQANVSNTGSYNGAEVVQLYSSAFDTELPVPLRELRAFHKTKCLRPGESETVELTLNTEDLRVFDPDKHVWKIQKGRYILSAGTHSRNTVEQCCVEVKEDIILQRVKPILPLPKDAGLHEISAPEQRLSAGTLPVFVLSSEAFSEWPVHDDRGEVVTYTTDPAYEAVMPYEKVKLVEKVEPCFRNVQQGKVSLETFVGQLSNEELIHLNCGIGWGVVSDRNPMIGNNAKTVPGAAGETTHELEKYGVPSIVVADGPGGIRLTQVFEAWNPVSRKQETMYHFCTAWPCGTLVAQSFCLKAVREMGEAIADELEEMQVSILLAPGMNIHRDPLCGRNFEYYSEDPFVSGTIAAALTKGIQKNGTSGTCIKHFAANNQETNRSRVNEFISERTLREIYLRGFEIAVKESQPMSIMTSYNLINGVPTADSRDLCTEVARNEWGFEGLIMTDWNGGSSKPPVSMYAGNDLIMPGGSSKRRDILLAMEIREPEFDERGQVVFTLFSPMSPAVEPHWNSFRLSAEGSVVKEVSLGEGHAAEIKDHLVLCDGKEIYTAATDRRVYFRGRGKGIPTMIEPLTDEMASVSSDGKTIYYRGDYYMDNPICRGDLQQCAIRNLRVILRTTQR